MPRFRTPSRITKLCPTAEYLKFIKYIEIVISNLNLEPVVFGASTKSHASGNGIIKFKIRSFRIVRMGPDVFLDADSKSPHMT